MNIGILSMQKIHNYGSFLQALSLKLQFEARGHAVYFIDILPGKQIAEIEAPEHISLLSKIDKYFFKRIENYLLSKKMTAIHISDYETYLETGKVLPQGESFDLVVIGSDEVFNATTPSRWGFSPQLFGKVDNAKCVVTYAASCGHTTFEAAEKYGIIKELQDAMQELKHISVRDENTADFVRKLLGKEPEMHVDPVLISSFDAFIPEPPKRKPYVLVYAYGNRIHDKKEIAAIKQYAKKHKLDILCVGMQQRWCKHNIPATGFELLSYVKGAACVVTDTFHGTVFSIKYNKKFVSLIRDSNRNKLGGLLRQFGLLERSVADLNAFDAALDAPIDFDALNSKIEDQRQKAYSYIDMIAKAEK
jgi:hypothetical protein